MSTAPSVVNETVPRGRLRDLGLKLLLLVVSLTFVALLLEGLVRVLGLQTASYHSISGFCRYDPDLGWNLVPEHRVVFKGRHFSALVETSEQGLRDRHFPLQPEEGRRRILFLGDSVVWCWGVAIEECFTKRLESSLRDTEVITMGVPGYSTAQAMRLYELQGARFNPDVVVYVMIANDLAENLDRRKRPHFVIRDGELEQTNHPVARRKGALKEWLTQNSELYTQARFRMQVAQEMLKVLREKLRRDGPQGDRSSYATVAIDDEDSWRLYMALLDRLRSRVLADGAEFVVVSVELDPEFSERLDRYCAERGCRMIDAGVEIRAADTAGRAIRLRGDPHFAPEGQQLLTDVLLPALEG